ncbi:hypothetical protein BDY21DRAFT_346883 [Lineolata rhizophorae]|uniref:RRM domain-containing protein n=1 Tax=Lineolata rhizophorae TaxID=578093 RepID=A0A6A6NXV6_9PEZI|nr:hypothetical protein BDY21DRAFT_346883 [Lineolata rhizophorae]
MQSSNPTMQTSRMPTHSGLPQGMMHSRFATPQSPAGPSAMPSQKPTVMQMNNLQYGHPTLPSRAATPQNNNAMNTKTGDQGDQVRPDLHRPTPKVPDSVETAGGQNADEAKRLEDKAAREKKAREEFKRTFQENMEKRHEEEMNKGAGNQEDALAVWYNEQRNTLALKIKHESILLDENMKRSQELSDRRKELTTEMGALTKKLEDHAKKEKEARADAINIYLRMTKLQGDMNDLEKKADKNLKKLSAQASQLNLSPEAARVGTTSQNTILPATKKHSDVPPAAKDTSPSPSPRQVAMEPSTNPASEKNVDPTQTVPADDTKAEEDSHLKPAKATSQHTKETPSKDTLSRPTTSSSNDFMTTAAVLAVHKNTVSPATKSPGPWTPVNPYKAKPKIVEEPKLDTIGSSSEAEKTGLSEFQKDAARANVQTEGINRFNAWPRAIERQVKPLKVRSVKVSNIPSNFTIEKLYRHVWGGNLEGAQFKPGSSTAIVFFMQPEGCSQYVKDTANGVDVKNDNGTNTGGVLYVDKRNEPDPVSARLESYIKAMATRCVLVERIDKEWGDLGLKRAAGLDSRSLAFMRRGTNKFRELWVEFQFTWIADAMSFYCMVVRDEIDWSGVEVHFAADPCALVFFYPRRDVGTIMPTLQTRRLGYEEARQVSFVLEGRVLEGRVDCRGLGGYEKVLRHLLSSMVGVSILAAQCTFSTGPSSSKRVSKTESVHSRRSTRVLSK